MDRRPIGVFDSGLGGLTALRELSRLLPREELIYFGDTGRVPYGSRSRETIIKYARQDVAFLRSFQPKAIVIACGTVSTTAMEILAQENRIPVLGVVEPAAAAAAQASRNGKIGLIGTEASIRSGAYEEALAQLRPQAQVMSLACPLFVPLVENGRFRPGDKVAELVVEEYLSGMRRAGVDTLVLGCTHYPLLAELIGDFMGPEVALIDVGRTCADAVAGRLADMDALSAAGRTGESRYYVSDSAEDFSRLASVFLRRDVEEAVTQVEIWNY